MACEVYCPVSPPLPRSSVLVVIVCAPSGRASRRRSRGRMMKLFTLQGLILVFMRMRVTFSPKLRAEPPRDGSGTAALLTGDSMDGDRAKRCPNRDPAPRANSGRAEDVLKP